MRPRHAYGLNAAPRTHRATAKRPAILRQDHPGWIHVTHPDNIASIVARGLLVEPPQRVYAATDPFATLGGIYVAPAQHLDSLIDRYCEMWGEAVILHVTLLAGTRFCLDEDAIEEFAFTDDDGLQAYAALFGATRALLDKAIAATIIQTPGTRLRRDRTALDRWSCRLATMLDQSQLAAFDLRLFDPPQIDDIVIERCRR